MPNKTPIFTPETFRFFRELRRNNSKAWMDANRERYQEHVVAPFRALLAALTEPALKLHPEFDTGGRTGTNFSRINRDIRFSKDKTPYYPHMYLKLVDHAAKGREGAQLYVGVAADSVTIGFRIYGGSKGEASALDRVAKLRAAKRSDWLKRQAQRVGRKYDSYWYLVDKGDWAKHDGWPTEPEDWAKLQGWIVRRKLKPAAALRPGFVHDAAKTFRELFPLYAFTSLKNWRG
jgi:uncharacterized protein (TIGR02453 family)